MKELTLFLQTYQQQWNGVHPITADVFLALLDKFKDYQ